MTPIDREHLAIGRAIYRAAETLPEGWEVCINIERDAVTVEAFSPDGNVLRIDFGDSFSEQINLAINVAGRLKRFIEKEPSHDNQ